MFERRESCAEASLFSSSFAFRMLVLSRLTWFGGRQAVTGERGVALVCSFSFLRILYCRICKTAVQTVRALPLVTSCYYELDLIVICTGAQATILQTSTIVAPSERTRRNATRTFAPLTKSLSTELGGTDATFVEEGAEVCISSNADGIGLGRNARSLRY